MDGRDVQGYKPQKQKADDLLSQWVVEAPETPAVRVSDPQRKWRMISALQKAVRRGDVDTALKMAEGVRQVDPAYLWRRLTIIGFEDVGIADLDGMMALVRFCSAKAVREQHGEKPGLMALVRRLCEAPGDRTACDGPVAVYWHRNWHAARQNMAELSDHELQLIALDEHQPRTTRIMALTLLRGQRDSEDPKAGFPSRKGGVGPWFKAVRGLGVPDDVLYTVRQANAIGCDQMSMPFALLWQQVWGDGTRPRPQTHDDPMPEVEMIGPYPSYTFDWHTQEGKRALAYFAKMETPVAKLIQHLPFENGKQRVDFLGDLLFRAEGDLLARRLVWAGGILLRQLSSEACVLYFDGTTREGLWPMVEAMRNSLDALNYARRKIVN